ncbi:hypothetical protein [Microbacterium sp. C7(2022)]|nr:hypothetical protein [Microbacterium sp. C7(2022)]MDE0545919.1 hypothetical protein [Microbacterium sp. C7(2022)]
MFFFGIALIGTPAVVVWSLVEPDRSGIDGVQNLRDRVLTQYSG